MSNTPPDLETDADPCRRDFLRRAAILSGAAGLLSLPAWSRNALAAMNSSHAGGQYALELDGQFADYIKAFASVVNWDFVAARYEAGRKAL